MRSPPRRGSPIIESAALLETVRSEFGIQLSSISQVFGGQDSDAVVLRATSGDGAEFAVKVSRSHGVSGLLVSDAIARTIAIGIPEPLRIRSGPPYSIVNGLRVSLIPWISGLSAAGKGLDAAQWRSFGALLSRVHSADVTPMLASGLPVEEYRTPAAASARVLDRRIRDQDKVGPTEDEDSLTAALIRDWMAAADSLALVLAQIDGLGDELRSEAAGTVVCHCDAHIGNVLISDDGEVWLLDWDEVVRAPRERDLMFVIDGVLGDPVTAEQQEWFFDGYGQVDIDPRRLAYYQCSWALQDVADFAARVLDRAGPPAEAGQALALFRSVVGPSGIVSLAVRSLNLIGRTARA